MLFQHFNTLDLTKGSWQETLTQLFSIPWNHNFDCTLVVRMDTGSELPVSEVGNGKEHPILYLSRKFSSAERNYAMIEREAIAIKWTIEELRFLDII